MTRDELNQSNQNNILGAGKVTKNRHWTHNDNIADYVDESIVAIPENADVVAAIVEEVLNTDTIKDIEEKADGALQSVSVEFASEISPTGADGLILAEKDDTPNGDGGESQFIRQNNKLFYLVAVEQ